MLWNVSYIIKWIEHVRKSCFCCIIFYLLLLLLLLWTIKKKLNVYFWCCVSYKINSFSRDSFTSFACGFHRILLFLFRWKYDRLSELVFSVARVACVKVAWLEVEWNSSESTNGGMFPATSHDYAMCCERQSNIHTAAIFNLMSLWHRIVSCFTFLWRIWEILCNKLMLALWDLW